jgi:para-nitrobenzyl esterase
MKSIFTISGLIVALLLPLLLPAQTTRIESGLIEGIMENGVEVYKGIPFAAAPIGDLRWRPPQPVEPWEGVLKANKFAPAAIQPNIKVLGYLDYGMSEDCLYLNIWKPDTSGKSLPVVVWIHGGGFNLGSTSQAISTGEQLAKKGVIVVSIAYRLGILGFFSHPELSAESENHVSGNYGLLDQIFALQWVQRNIAAFGGDSSNVTLFGLSAGGQSVNLLAASPLAKGLFHKAISMSGGAFMPTSTVKNRDCILTLESAEASGLEFANSLGAKSIADLRSIDPQRFVGELDMSGGLPLVVDGYVIIDDLYKLYESGNYNDIPVLLGNTSGEGTMFVLNDKPADYEETTRQRYGPSAVKILNLYPKGDKDVTSKSMADLFRDTYFGWFNYSWSRLQSRTGKSPVYVYYFNQEQPKSMITLFAKSRDAYHGSDCAYVFGHLDQNPKIKYTEADSILSQIMLGYWINFIKYGNPNSPRLPEWPAYSPEKPSVLYLNSHISVGPQPNLEKLQAIEEYYLFKRIENSK